jgi:hypothetical protein
MPTIVNCPGCNRSLSIPDTMAGKQVQCPTCRRIFATAPPPAPEAAAPPGYVITLDPPEPAPANPFDFRAGAGPSEGAFVTSESIVGPSAADLSFVPQQPPPEGMARTATLLLVIGCFLEAIQLVTVVAFPQPAGPGQNFASITPEGFPTALCVGGCTALLVLMTLVVVLLWIHEAHAYLRYLHVQGKAFSPGAAVGWFFVPVACLVMPCLAMQELWKASDPESPPADAHCWKTKPGSGLIAFWWGSGICSLLLLLYVFLGTSVRPDADQLVIARAAQAGQHVLSLFGAICLVCVIQGVQKRQLQKYEKLQRA